MKTFFIGVCCALSAGAFAQTVTTKTYPAQAGQKVKFDFDYPVVKISTWDKNEVSVTAKVNINEDENDNAFVLEEKNENGALVISDQIKDIDQLPRRYTIYRDGKKTVYRSKAEYEQDSHKGGAERTSEGVDMEIVLEIKVPASCLTNMQAKYGIVELTNFNAPITIDDTYGGIDATIATAHTGKLEATTHYGQIYSNLDMKITDHREADFFNSITAEPGKGPAYNFISDYGKIYLRKPL